MAEYNSSYTGLQIDDAVGKSLAALPVDNTLSATGKAADAKKTGDELNGLKSAINGINGQIEISTLQGYYIALKGTTANVNSPTEGIMPIECAAVSCKANDVFTINATGTKTPRAWGFVDANGNIIAKAYENANVNNLILVAPDDSAYLVINNTDLSKRSFIGESIAHKVNNLEELTYGAENDLTDQFIFSSSHRIKYFDGTYVSGGSHFKATKIFIDISKYDKLRLTIMQVIGFQGYGIAFYSGESEDSFISGIQNIPSDSGGTQIKVVDIPLGANYVRVTYWSNADIQTYGYPAFSCYGIIESEKNKFEDLQGEIESQNCVSILFVGNSLTQDGISYLPYILRTYYPDIKFKLYMWYNGGATLADHYNRFVNNTPCRIFSVAENTVSWTNFDNSITMEYILDTYRFDVVCMQEYFNERSTYTDSDLTDWNDCRNYITNHYTGGNGLEFVSLFHAPIRNNADNVFNLTVEGNNLILQKTIADDMIPNGIAVYRALSTDLDNLGDEGHLSPDGIHAQEGLPCLMQTFVTLRWLFERHGIDKSIYGCPARMTTEIYDTINVPGANLGTGVITGTDAQNLLAQEVAIQAVKEGKYYVENNIFAPSN